MRLITIILLILFVHGCAPKTKTPTISAEEARLEAQRQTEAAISARVDMHSRVMRVAYPVLTKNVAACEKDARWHAGFHGITSKGLSDTEKTAWAKLYSVDEKLTVFTITPGSPADKGGLIPRDKIVSVNGESEGIWYNTGLHKKMVRGR